MNARFHELLQQQEREDALVASDEKLADEYVTEEFKEAEALLGSGRASSFSPRKAICVRLSFPRARAADSI